jgi:hypothetical protein
VAYGQRDFSGALFANKKKTDERHPNSTGKAMIAGTMYYVSGWTKTSASGEKWISLAFKPVDEMEQRHPPESSQEEANPF